MKKEQIFLITGIIAIAIIWHLIIVSSESKTISGIFQTKPKLGYSWKNTSTYEPRYFWQNITARWTAGIKHPDHNVVSSYIDKSWVAMLGYVITDNKTLSTQWKPGLDYPDLHATSGEREGYWNAYPGYTFSTNSSDYTYTVWTPGLYHPNGKLTSGEIEGQWVPCLGYEWFSTWWSIGTAKKELRWVPGIKYASIHVVTSNIENQFIPFPGYQFVDSARSITVFWKPGVVNPLNSDLISGDKEGTWVNVNTTTSETSDNTQWFDYIGAAILYNTGGKLTDKLAGEGNKYSNDLYKESLINLIKGGIKLFQKK